MGGFKNDIKDVQSMRIVILSVIVLGVVGTWLYLGAGNRELKPYVRNGLPFTVYAPKYIPAGLSLDKKATEGLSKGTNIGIPQFNLIYTDAAGTSGMAVTQFDRARFKKDILDAEKIGSFPDYFTRYRKASLVKKGGFDLYIVVSSEKVKTVFGDMDYIAQGFLLKDDSLIQVNYSGANKFSEDEMTRVLLSFSKV